jgi:hypothetical protein
LAVTLKMEAVYFSETWGWEETFTTCCEELEDRYPSKVCRKHPEHL